MKYISTGLAMTFLLFMWNTTIAQRLESDFSLSAAGGSVSNTYLMPLIPEWDRSRISGYTSLSPAGQLRWRGSGRSVSLYGSGHVLHFYDDRPSWVGGYVTPVFRQHITSGLSMRASGGWSYYSSTYNRNMQWLLAGMEWMTSPFSKLELSVGSGWRTYYGLADWPEETRRFDSYGLEFQYWPGYRWQLWTSFNSSLAHILRPADGFAVSVAVAYYRKKGTMMMLQTGLEQYSMEFQSDLGNGSSGASGGDHSVLPLVSLVEIMPNDEIIRLEDRFHRTTLRVTHPFSDWMTLTGSIAGLLWFSSEDNDIVSDFQVSAGVQVPISIPVSSSGEIRSMRWTTQSRQARDRDPERNRISNYTSDPEERIHDQELNKALVQDANQKLLVTLTVQYRGDASLYITGDFIDWDDPGIPLHKAGRNRYRAEIDLSVGVYEYKIGKLTSDQHKWLELPDDVSTVDDGFGGRNGRIIIDY